MSEEACVIRPVCVEDMPRLRELYRDFIDDSTSGMPGVSRNPDLDAGFSLARLMKRADSEMLVAECEGAPVGFAWVEFRRGTAGAGGIRGQLRGLFTHHRRAMTLLFEDRGWLGNLYVQPVHRRKGIASALVGASAEWTRRRGGESLELNVLTANEAARGLYGKLGMTETLLQYRMEL